MANQTFASFIENNKLMSSGIKNNVDLLTARGLGPEYSAEYDGNIDEVENVNFAQERLKADLKTKTTEMATKKKALQVQYSQAKSIVKATVPKDRWLEFGIQDKR